MRNSSFEGLIVHRSVILREAYVNGPWPTISLLQVLAFLLILREAAPTHLYDKGPWPSIFLS